MSLVTLAVGLILFDGILYLSMWMFLLILHHIRERPDYRKHEASIRAVCPEMEMLVPLQQIIKGSVWGLYLTCFTASALLIYAGYLEQDFSGWAYIAGIIAINTIGYRTDMMAKGYLSWLRLLDELEKKENP